MTTSFQPSADQSATPPEATPQGTSFTEQKPDDSQNTPPEGVTPQLSAEEVASLVKRDVNAQSHITTLESETADLKTQLADMQAKLDQAAEVEEVLKAQGQSTVDVDDIVTKATQAISQQQAQSAAEEKQTNNFKEVSNALSEKFGADKVDDAVKAACEENGMSWESMVALAKSNPKAALKLCDVQVKAPAQPTQTSINTSAVYGSYQENRDTPTKVNVMELRTTAEQVADYQRRMAEFSKNNPQ